MKSLQRDIEEVQDVVTENIGKILERGERLEILLEAPPAEWTGECRQISAKYRQMPADTGRYRHISADIGTFRQ